MRPRTDAQVGPGGTAAVDFDPKPTRGRIAVGVVAIRLLVYALWIGAGTCFILALIVLVGGTTIWMQLENTSGLVLGAKLVAAGCAAVALGFLILFLFDRLLARRAQPPLDIAP